MRTVSRFEANLLRVLQCFLRRVPVEQAVATVAGNCAQPECLSRDAVALIQDFLAKGATLYLARCSGWRRERFLRGEHVVNGRLWERTPPAELGLVFSRHTIRFLVWITARKPSDAGTWSAPAGERTPADNLLLYLAYTALRSTEVSQSLRPLPGFVDNALCRLAHPEDFPAADGSVLDFHPWTDGVGACILEALQLELAEHWVTSERAKGQVLDWHKLSAYGRAQEQVLQTFLAAVEEARRRDLARFLLQAVGRLLTPDATMQMWVNVRAASGVRLADRVETYRAALALVARVARFRQWEQQARTVGYFDEGYAASQLFKSEWERWGGDELATRAERIVRTIDPLQLPTTEGRT